MQKVPFPYSSAVGTKFMSVEIPIASLLIQYTGIKEIYYSLTIIGGLQPGRFRRPCKVCRKNNSFLILLERGMPAGERIMVK